MTATQTTPPPGGKTDSGEHAAADRSLRMRFGSNRIDIPLVATAKFIAVMVPVILALVTALRAPSKGDVDAAKAKATEVRQELVTPVNKSTKEQADLQAQLARMAAAIETLEKARQSTPPAPAPGQPKRRHGVDPETAKKVAAAVGVLKAVQVKAAAAPKPQTLPVEPPKEQGQQQQQRDAGGSNP